LPSMNCFSVEFHVFIFIVFQRSHGTSIESFSLVENLVMDVSYVKLFATNLVFNSLYSKVCYIFN